MVKTIEKGEIVEIQVVDDKTEVKLEEKTEKAASPPTMEMVLARIDKLTSIVTELSGTVKTLKAAPKVPPKKDEEEEKEKPKKKEEKAVEKVEEKEDKIDVVALITKLVEKEVGEKIGEQPIQKRSTAPAEIKKFDTPMDIPASIMATADPESILRLGGYTTKRRNK